MSDIDTVRSMSWPLVFRRGSAKDRFPAEPSNTDNLGKTLIEMLISRPMVRHYKDQGSSLVQVEPAQQQNQVMTSKPLESASVATSNPKYEYHSCLNQTTLLRERKALVDSVNSGVSDCIKTICCEPPRSGSRRWKGC